jgi:hypothetical protein
MFETILTSLIQATLTGIGVALGTYFAQRGLIKHLENIESKIKKNIKS